MFPVLVDVFENGLLHVLVAVEDVVVDVLKDFLRLRLVEEDAREQHDVLIRHEIERPVQTLAFASLRDLVEGFAEALHLVHRHLVRLRLLPGVRQGVEGVHQFLFGILLDGLRGLLVRPRTIRRSCRRDRLAGPSRRLRRRGLRMPRGGRPRLWCLPFHIRFRLR